MSKMNFIPASSIPKTTNTFISKFNNNNNDDDDDDMSAFDDIDIPTSLPKEKEKEKHIINKPKSLLYMKPNLITSSSSDNPKYIDLYILLKSYIKLKDYKNSKDIYNILINYIITYGIDDNNINGYTNISNRGIIWKLLLHGSNINSKEYISLINKNKSNKYKEIRDDSFRTFASYPTFFDVVPEVAIIRVCNSFQHLYGSNTLAYRQGMNALCGVLLFVMPEVDVFYCFCNIIQSTKLYWQPTLDGAHAGCYLVDTIVQQLDPELFNHLKKFHLTCAIYGFSLVLSFSCSVPPFNQLLGLWDHLICTGMQWNVLAVAAQVLLHKKEIMIAAHPKHFLDYRKWPPLDSVSIVNKMTELKPLLSDECKSDINLHASDINVLNKILGRK